MRWQRINIETNNGLREGIAPLVISASRATDIPAFHGAWLANRLKAGYCLWQNPFNAAQRQYVGFQKTRVFVFWSKNPRPFFPVLAQASELGFRHMFHYTLNDYEKENLEPGLPPLADRIAVFRQLAALTGKLLWRFDPVILGGSLSPAVLVERIRRIASQIGDLAAALTFSFVDFYEKTRRGLKPWGFAAPDKTQMRIFAAELAEAAQKDGWPFPTRICGEDMDFSHLGIDKARCVDGALISDLCPDDPEIRKIYGQTPHALLPGLNRPRSRDSGQRKTCHCAPSKDIGAYSSCSHFCAYCYANASPHSVRQRLKKMDTRSEMLVPPD